MPLCKNCGLVIKEERKFCPRCGSKVLTDFENNDYEMHKQSFIYPLDQEKKFWFIAKYYFDKKQYKECVKFCECVLKINCKNNNAEQLQKKAKQNLRKEKNATA